ncbi:MAG TPA: SPFH domain-containing protein [Candidatus Limnocylindria bacterium]|nr:SPFH domain-containing protein [Candidatus Limnocylindria bacterium]
MTLTVTELVLTTLAVLVLIALFAAQRYRVAGANEALVISGARGSKVRDEKGDLVTIHDQGVKVVVGAGTFTWPLVNKVGRLQLTARQVEIGLAHENAAVSKQGVGVLITGQAMFKIAREPERLRAAAERFIGEPDSQIETMVKKVLEGSLRSIAGTLTIEELITDRDRFQQAVSEAARGDLEASGIHIDALTITSIRDTKGYIEQLGEKNLASVQRDARIAKASASQEAAVKENEAQRVIIQAERDREIARAEAHKVTAKAQAEADQSGPLAQATATKDVIKEQTELAELEAVRREKELLGTTVKPAEAERRAAIVKAEGARQATILAAEAHAQQVQLTGEAEGAANVARGRAAAQVTEISGAAEGAAILSRGQAEARSKELLAEAYRKFDEAAILLQTLPLVPPIVREAAAPLGNIDNLTVIDPSGASKLTETVVRTAAEGTAIAKSLLGVDLAELMGRLATRRNGDEKT